MLHAGRGSKRKMERRTTFLFALCAAVASFLCQMISFGSPGWCIIEKPFDSLHRIEKFVFQKVLEEKTVYVNAALWYVTLDIKKIVLTRIVNSSSKTSSYRDIFRREGSWESRILETACGINNTQAIETEVEATIGLILCCFGVGVTLMRYRVESRSQSRNAGRTLGKPLIPSMLFLLISGVLILVPVWKMFMSRSEYKLSMTEVPREYDTGFIEVPYGLIFAAIGGSLAVIASVMLFGMCCQPLQVNNQLNDTAENIAPMIFPDNQETVLGQTDVADPPPSYAEVVKQLPFGGDAMDKEDHTV